MRRMLSTVLGKENVVKLDSKTVALRINWGQYCDFARFMQSSEAVNNVLVEDQGNSNFSLAYPTNAVEELDVATHLRERQHSSFLVTVQLACFYSNVKCV